MKVQDESLKSSLPYSLAWVVPLVLCLTFPSQGLAKISGTISKVGDATHIEFRGLKNWDYLLERKNPSEIKLTVPAFDQVTETSLLSWGGRLLEDVKVDKTGPDSRYIITFKLGQADVESFDYLTDDPSRLIIDFYKKPVQEESVPQGDSKIKNLASTSKKPAAKAKATKKALKSKKSKVVESGYTKRQRSPAGSEILEVLKKKANLKDFTGTPMRGVFDGGDPTYERFKVKDYEIREESIIASRQNIYIRFPILKLNSDRFKKLIENPPEYVINPRDDKENKEARLLKVLYSKGRLATFLKTYEYFVKQYPESIYDEIVRNMAAEVYYKVWQRDKNPTDLKKFRNMYRYLASKYPGSVLADRTQLILAYSHFERGEAIETLRSFLEYLKNNPRSEERDRAKLAIAESYIKLKKPQDALSVFKDLEKSADNKNYSIEATYRLGDVYMDQRKYKEAVAAYKRAIRKYPAHVSIHPNAQYNMSEAQFWLGDYKKGIANFTEFLRLYPSHTHGGYAMTRIGELLEILGVDRSRVIGAFVESYFRFRSSPGAEVARIRMLSQRLKGMREKEVRKALEEMENISKNSKLPRISEFTSLMVADGLHRRGEYHRSLDTLVAYYQQNPTSSNLSFFRKRILRNISDVINEDLKKGDFLEVLKTNGKYSTNWLRKSDRIDIPYFISRAYEQAGVLEEAKKGYEDLHKKLKKIQGTEEHLERRVNEHLPTLDQIQLRLAVVALDQRKYRDAYKYISRTGKDLEDKEQVEKVSVAAKISLKRGDSKSSKRLLRKLIDTWQGQPELVAPIYVQLAKLELDSKNFDEAEDLVGYVEGMSGEESNLSDEVVAQALEVKGDIHVKKGQSVSAVQSYLDLLEKFEEKRPLSGVRYRVGKILFDKGDIKGAEKIWAALDTGKGKFYYGLAKEKLNSAKWQDEYKKYINRIPAAAEIR